MPDFKLIASYFFSLLIIAAIIYLIDPSKVFEQISRFGILQAFIGIVLVFFSYIFRAIIWKELLSPFADVQLKEAYHITVAGFFLNNFLPLRAGEIARAFLLNQSKQIGKLKIFSTIIVERIVEGLSLALLFFGAIFFIPGVSQSLLNLMIFSSVFFAVLFFAFIFSDSTKNLLQKIFGFSVFFREKILFLFEEIFIGKAAFKKGIKENILIWGASLCLWIIYFILYYFVSKELLIQIGFFELIIILAVSTLSTVIPSAPGYIGTFEAGFILAFTALGLGFEQGTSMAIIIHLIFLVGTSILGIVSFRGLKISFSDLTKISLKKNQPL